MWDQRVYHWRLLQRFRTYKASWLILELGQRPLLLVLPSPMLFLTRVVPALFAAASLVQASVIARADNDTGTEKDVWFCGFIAKLNMNNLTVLADNYERIAKTDQGKVIIQSLKNGGDITLLAPDNCAFNLSHPIIDDPNVLLHNALSSSIDKGFGSAGTSLRRRDGAVQSHSVVPSQFGGSGGGAKRQSGSYSAQVVTQTFNLGRKRLSSSETLVDLPVGNSKVTDRFTYHNIIILVINKLVGLPQKGGDLFCQPLIDAAPNGFPQFDEGLKRTGLSDKLESCDQSTVFVPLDDYFPDIDKLSKDELSCLIGNHVAFGTQIYSTSFSSVGKVTTESGKELVLSFENGVNYVKCGDGKRRSMVLRRDVMSSNGVVHVIDRPLKCD